MSKRQKEITIYKRDGGRLYADFRPLGGKLEALIPEGETRATTDLKIAQILKGERIKVIENERRQGIVSTGRSQETMLGAFAAYHLKQKKDNNEATDWTLGGVQRSLERAVEFFGASKPLSGIDPHDGVVDVSFPTLPAFLTRTGGSETVPITYNGASMRLYDCDGTCGTVSAGDPAVPRTVPITSGVLTLTLGDPMASVNDASRLVQVNITNAQASGTYTAVITAQIALR